MNTDRVDERPLSTRAELMAKEQLLTGMKVGDCGAGSAPICRCAGTDHPFGIRGWGHRSRITPFLARALPCQAATTWPRTIGPELLRRAPRGTKLQAGHCGNDAGIIIGKKNARSTGLSHRASHIDVVTKGHEPCIYTSRRRNRRRAMSVATPAPSSAMVPGSGTGAASSNRKAIVLSSPK
jgi:hypothetical protein